MSHVLRFRVTNRDIWNTIKRGEKKVETRAATTRYRKIEVGDRVTLACGKGQFMRTVKKVVIFRTIRALTHAYKPRAINPKCRTVRELEMMYFSFPGYREKLKKHGVVALELK